MATLKVRELDINNPEDLVPFEQAMYQAFSIYPDRAYENIWVFDHESKRVKTIVPYDGQRIIVAEANGEVVGALQINIAMEGELQLEKFGFSVSRSLNNAVEVLSLFANQQMVGLKLVMVELVLFAEKILRPLKIKTIWATCNESLVVPYKTLGFRDIDAGWINGQDKYLIQREVGGLKLGDIKKGALQRAYQSIKQNS
jgi:hypothetical protein